MCRGLVKKWSNSFTVRPLFDAQFLRWMFERWNQDPTIDIEVQKRAQIVKVWQSWCWECHSRIGQRPVRIPNVSAETALKSPAMTSWSWSGALSIVSSNEPFCPRFRRPPMGRRTPEWPYDRLVDSCRWTSHAVSSRSDIGFQLISEHKLF